MSRYRTLRTGDEPPSLKELLCPSGKKLAKKMYSRSQPCFEGHVQPVHDDLSQLHSLLLTLGFCNDIFQLYRLAYIASNSATTENDRTCQEEIVAWSHWEKPQKLQSGLAHPRYILIRNISANRYTTTFSKKLKKLDRKHIYAEAWCKMRKGWILRNSFKTL
jgi:hypothetical protein